MEEARRSKNGCYTYVERKQLLQVHLELSEAAIKKYGNLGKLIEAEVYYVPTLVLPDCIAMGIHPDNVTVIMNDAMKELVKEVGEMNRGILLPYGLIGQHMSIESRDKVSQQLDYIQ
jgi:hypothetical protein